jgi:thioredoxin reductase (NADPH)
MSAAAEPRDGARPVVLVVDDEPSVARAVERDLRRRYGRDYRVLRAESGGEALEAVREAKLRGTAVALMVADQRMPAMSGVEFLEQAMLLVPDAKRVLLTAYADTQAAIDAINRVSLDQYLLKPWDPPEEQLYPVLDDLLDAWRAEAPADSDRIQIVGHRWSKESHEARDFLARNQVPYRWLDVERDDEARRLLAAANGDAVLPLVLFPGGDVLRAPSVAELADRAGVRRRAELPFYDLVIVGAGPAGLAAAVYGASEGLQTALIERQAPGGQAGQSSRIENYLGFPVGLSGSDLARRATAQAQRFGAELLTVQEVTEIDDRGPATIVRLAGGDELGASAVIVSTGVDYRRLDAPGVEQLTGRGVYYGGSRSEGVSCRDERVVVVGGANSAGQAAIYFAGYAQHVTILYRGDSLAKNMSRYLIDTIEATANIDVRVNGEVAAAHGDQSLERITVRDTVTGELEELALAAMFVFIGAHPQTDWLPDAVARDRRGFVLAGAELLLEDVRPRWRLDRDPYLLETSLPGVFVAGDVRSQSMKRVASAVGWPRSRRCRTCARAGRAVWGGSTAATASSCEASDASSSRMPPDQAARTGGSPTLPPQTATRSPRPRSGRAPAVSKTGSCAHHAASATAGRTPDRVIRPSRSNRACRVRLADPEDAWRRRRGVELPGGASGRADVERDVGMGELVVADGVQIDDAGEFHARRREGDGVGVAGSRVHVLGDIRSAPGEATGAEVVGTAERPRGVHRSDQEALGGGVGHLWGAGRGSRVAAASGGGDRASDGEQAAADSAVVHLAAPVRRWKSDGSGVGAPALYPRRLRRASGASPDRRIPPTKSR